MWWSGCSRWICFRRRITLSVWRCWRASGPGAEVTLASASPRRRELLGDLGIDFRVAPSNIPEEPGDGETPEAMARRLSREKALAVAESEGAVAGYYIGADSTVAAGGGVHREAGGRG